MIISEFTDFEKRYWLRHTPIGFVFGLDRAMGLIMGTIILCQVPIYRHECPYKRVRYL